MYDCGPIWGNGGGIPVRTTRPTAGFLVEPSGANEPRVRTTRVPQYRKLFRALPTHIIAILPLGDILITRRGFADRNTLAGEHALVYDGIPSKEEEIGGYETELRRDQVDDVSDHQLARILLNPCQGMERLTKKCGGTRIELTCAIDEHVYRAREPRHLPHACDCL
jgi:hypothetical protein